MGHPLDHRRSAVGGTRLHVYVGPDRSVAAITGPAMAMMFRYATLHSVV